MRILLAGQKRFGRDVLELISRLGHTVVAVACPVLAEPDKTWIAARNRSLPIIPAGTLTAETMPADVDLIVCAHSHDFIGRKTRNKARYEAIGFQPSLLPLHRGRDAIRWTIRMREPVTGGTVYWLNDTVDGGPIIVQDWCFVRPDDDALSLWRRELAPMGLRLFEHALAAIASGNVRRVEQDHTMATWEPALDHVPRLTRPDLEQIGHNGLNYHG